MFYLLKIKIDVDGDAEAKEIMNNLLDEADSLRSMSGIDATGELFYSDGETRVP